jgi:hypothetical protein
MVTAVRALQSQTHAEKMLARIRRLQNSQHYQKIGPAGASMLDALPRSVKEQLREGKPRLEKALGQLQDLPMFNAVVNAKQIDLDMDGAEALCLSVFEHIESLRPHVEYMEATRKRAGQASEPPQKLQKLADGTGIPSADEMAALERRLDDIEPGMMRRLLDDKVMEQLNRKVAANMDSWMKHHGYYVGEDGEVVEGEIAKALDQAETEKQAELRDALERIGTTVVEQAERLSQVLRLNASEAEERKRLALEHEVLKRQATKVCFIP